MIIAKKPVSGTTKENLELARPETERVLNFRGTVDSVNVLNGDIVTFPPKTVTPPFRVPRYNKTKEEGSSWYARGIPRNRSSLC
jgi:hypothetical protein